ncbi:hypothetical protein CSC82_10475 [Rhodobacteraceae bacterium 4F10]|nr:hypothetical protein CSC82_10475 [Rhodobacteraceae bacterium 4F10]
MWKFLLALTKASASLVGFVSGSPDAPRRKTSGSSKFGEVKKVCSLHIVYVYGCPAFLGRMGQKLLISGQDRA